MSDDVRTVLITGGSQGIGQATARQCLENGCRVILVARDDAHLPAAVDGFAQAGFGPDRVRTLGVDLEDTDAVEGWIADLPWVGEGLWGLVSNAALELIQPTFDFSMEEVDRSLAINVRTPFVMIKALYPKLKQARGNIVHVGSVADFKWQARYGVYAACKAFMKSLVGHLGQEIGWDGVRINTVSPGATETPLMKHYRDEVKLWPKEEIEGFFASIPIEQRPAHPEEIAEAIWFALSGPKYFHGEDIRVYGGHK